MNDYTEVDRKIAAMGLTERQNEVLLCKMDYFSTKRTAQALSVTETPIRKSLKIIRDKYFKTFTDRPFFAYER
jgi:DNA-binding CsgD family transcriptional regulator